MSRQVEWIGVKSPLQDPRITMRKIRGMYTDEEEILLEAVATIVGPLTRQYKSTARALGRAHGFSKEYLWGPRWFVVDMEDIDADRLFAMEDTEFEFRDHGNPAHDDREPVVPWMYITHNLKRIMDEAANGPGVVLKDEHMARNAIVAEQMIRKWRNDLDLSAEDRGIGQDDLGRLILPGRYR